MKNEKDPNSTEKFVAITYTLEQYLAEAAYRKHVTDTLEKINLTAEKMLGLIDNLEKRLKKLERVKNEH